MQTADGRDKVPGQTLQKKRNFSLIPSPDGWLSRGKKRKQDGRDVDSLSLCSLDINEPSTKRSKPLSRVTSLASLLPPVKTTPLKRIGQQLQRSISFRSESRNEIVPPSRPWPRPPSATGTRPQAPGTRPPTTASATKRRDSKLWSETFDVRLGATQPLSAREIKRQEAIFELSQGEEDLVEDLKLAKKAYHDPMLKLSIMTEQELNQIFGTLDSLIPLHEDLLTRLREARKSDGSTEHVGHILVDWLPCLDRYTPYCSNQVSAKALLDQRKTDRRVHDFLQRCLESPFSRKLDLWNFLDIPRSRLVKYPLLLKEILKHTPNDHPDRQHLEEAISMVQSIVADINTQTGESECLYYKQRLVYSDEGWRDTLIDRSRTLCCHGELKNNRGLKLHVFLFQDVLVITRSVSAGEQQISYQLCRQPIPMRHLELEDLPDGEMRVGGSIRGAFSNNERTKNFFRVSHRSGAQLQSHYFQASDTFNKQQWLNCIRQAQGAALAEDTSTEPCRAQEIGTGDGGRDVGGERCLSGGMETELELGANGEKRHGVDTEVEQQLVSRVGHVGEMEMGSGVGGGQGLTDLRSDVVQCVETELGGDVGQGGERDMETGPGEGLGQCVNGEIETGLGGSVGTGLVLSLSGGSGATCDGGVDATTDTDPNLPQNPASTTERGVVLSPTSLLSSPTSLTSSPSSLISSHTNFPCPSSPTFRSPSMNLPPTPSPSAEVVMEHCDSEEPEEVSMDTSDLAPPRRKGLNSGH